jgi:uncharacterized protein YbaP (TraB family)
MDVNTNSISHDFLYKIADPKTFEKKGYLVGACHLFDFSYELSDRIKEIFEKSESLIVENNVLNHYWEALFKILFSSEFMHITYIFAKIHPASFPGVDAKLIEIAKEDNKTIIELETLDKHLEVISKIAKPLLDIKVDSFEFNERINEIQKKVYEISTAYIEGSKEKLKDLAFTKKNCDNKSLMDLILYERNRKMADIIHGYLYYNHQPLVAVGVLHLYKKNKGEDGLITLLRRKGWHVTPVLNLEDLSKLHPQHPKTLEKLIAQDWCTPEMVVEKLGNNAIVTAKAILAGTSSPKLVDVVPRLFQQIQISYNPEYSLDTILKGIKPQYEFLLEDLSDKYPDIPTTFVYAALENKFSEKFVLKLMENYLSIPFSFISMALKKQYSEKFIMELLKRCPKKQATDQDVKWAFEGPYALDFIIEILEYSKEQPL